MSKRKGNGDWKSLSRRSAYSSEPGMIWIVPLVLLAILAVSYVTRPENRRV